MTADFGLQVSVPIKAAENDVQDDSGMYWIGEVDPRLYFCRILRSKTAMVRIGGGWQELSAYVLPSLAFSRPLTLLRSQISHDPLWQHLDARHFDLPRPLSLDLERRTLLALRQLPSLSFDVEQLDLGRLNPERALSFPFRIISRTHLPLPHFLVPQRRVAYSQSVRPAAPDTEHGDEARAVEALTFYSRLLSSILH